MKHFISLYLTASTDEDNFDEKCLIPGQKKFQIKATTKGFFSQNILN